MGGFKEWSERLRPGEENTRPPLLLRGAEPRERERERAAGGEAPRLVGGVFRALFAAIVRTPQVP